MTRYHGKKHGDQVALLTEMNELSLEVTMIRSMETRLLCSL